MGTLFDQLKRNYREITPSVLSDFLNKIGGLKDEYSLTTDQALHIYEILLKERELDIKINDFDIKDEQLAGFGELLREFNYSLGQAIDIYHESHHGNLNDKPEIL